MQLFFSSYVDLLYFTVLYVKLYLPSFFHQKITILIEQLMAGKVNCKLSIISIRFPWIRIRECIEGISTPSVIPKKTMNTRRLHSIFCREFWKVLGHNPIKSKMIRFNFTAHSKSTWRDFNRLYSSIESYV